MSKAQDDDAREPLAALCDVLVTLARADATLHERQQVLAAEVARLTMRLDQLEALLSGEDVIGHA